MRSPEQLFQLDQGPEEEENWPLGILISLWPDSDGNVHPCS